MRTPICDMLGIELPIFAFSHCRDVVDAVAPIPVRAAGGIGRGRQIAAALATGAQDVWMGSLWLTVKEADVPLAQMESYLSATSRDTVRTRAWTGKPARMLRNDWTEAGEAPGNPKPLGMPLQFMVAADAVVRGHRHPEQAKDVNCNPVGQIVGRTKSIRPVKDVIFDLAAESSETVERLGKFSAE